MGHVSELKKKFQKVIVVEMEKYQLERPWVPREYLGHVMKLGRYNGLWNGNRERSHNNPCVGPQGLNFWRKIYAGEGPTFPIVRSRKRCMRVNLQALRTSRLRRSLFVIDKKGSKLEVPKSRSGSTS